MEDQSKDKLPPLPAESFDGERFEATLPRDLPISQECKHNSVAFSENMAELRCACGNAWSGPNLAELYKLLKSRT